MKTDPSLNLEQNEAVYSRDGSILVSAPAGSGKTKILVNRMMSLIEDDGVNVDSLLVLTFTKAAALEMKQRLIESLNKRIEALEEGELKDHLIKQIPLLNDAYITNFHSFCSDLLAQYGHAINLDTQFTIVSDPTLIKERVFDTCLEKWAGEEDFQKFFVGHFAQYNFAPFKNLIFKLDTLTHNIYDFDNYFYSMEQELYQPIEDGEFEHSKIVSLIHENLKKGYHEGLNAYMDLLELSNKYGLGFFYTPQKKSAAPNDVLNAYYKQLFEEMKKPVFDIKKIEIEKHRNGVWKDVDPSVKETFSALLKTAKNAFNNAYDKCMPASKKDLQQAMKQSIQDLKSYLHYVKEFQEAYSSYKRQYSYLDFNDLEEYGLKLLDKDVGVSQTLYNQFHEIMIDEYQDTNEIQENLILKISRYDAPEIPRFMVGDMKQSIYRFRNADLDIFNDKYQSYKEDSNNNKRIDLVFNYRSNKIVLDSINYMFNAIMDYQYGGLEYFNDAYASLNYDFLRKDHCDDDVLLNEANLVLDNEERFDTEIMLMLKTEENSKELVEHEAMMIADKIHDMVGQLDLDFYYGNRKARYEDIVVLSRNVGNFITYKKVFQKANIPSLIVLTKGFFDSNEIIACVSFLQAINNALDDVAFVSFLKGHYAFSHKSESWIYQHKVDDLSMYESLLQCEDEDVQDVLSIYHSYVEFACHHPVYELLEKFILESKYDLFVSSLYNGQQRYANIQLFIDMLKNDAELSLYQIVENINQTIERGIEYKPATLPNDGNAVVFMTIHQSKGLEFPIVFVNQLNHQFNFDDGKQSLMYDKNLGMVTHVYKTEDLEDYKNVLIEYKNPIHGLFADRVTNETINEEMRILYVALTRASQKLILTGTIKKIKQLTSWQGKIIDYCLEANSPIIPASIRNTNNMLDWVMLSVMKHPQICQQMKDLTCMSRFIINSEELDEFISNASRLNLYAHILDVANIRHAKYQLHVMTQKDLHNVSYSTVESFDEDTYATNSTRIIASTNTLDKTAAVTSLIDDGDRRFQERGDSDETVKATDRGTIIHSVLEHLSLQCTSLDDELDVLYRAGLFDETEKVVIEGYKNHIQKFLGSDAYRIMQNAMHCFKEKEFSFVEENGQIIHGIFDVLCLSGNRITIIDYKTDRIAQDTPIDVLKELHFQQMDYYKKILRRTFPQADIQAIVYYLHIDKYVIF